jgi:hypothetical protein
MSEQELHLKRENCGTVMRTVVLTQRTDCAARDTTDTALPTGSTHSTHCSQDSWKAVTTRINYIDLGLIWDLGSPWRNNTQILRCDVLAAVVMKNTVSGISYSIVDIYWRFGGMCFFHLQDSIVRPYIFLISAYFSSTLGLLFDPDYGTSMLLRNISMNPPDNMASHLRWQ